MYLLHGLADITAPYQHGVALARALAEAGIIFRYQVSVVKQRHFGLRGGNLPRATAQWPFSDSYLAVVLLTLSHQSLYAHVHNRILQNNTNLPCFITAENGPLLLADMPHIA
jgi:hypothetical protein